MKRYRSLSIIMLVLLMLLVGCTGGTTEVYEQSTEPFTIDDVTGILGGLDHGWRLCGCGGAYQLQLVLYW